MAPAVPRCIGTARYARPVVPSRIKMACSEASSRSHVASKIQPGGGIIPAATPRIGAFTRFKEASTRSWATLSARSRTRPWRPSSNPLPPALSVLGGLMLLAQAVRSSTSALSVAGGFHVSRRCASASSVGLMLSRATLASSTRRARWVVVAAGIGGVSEGGVVVPDGVVIARAAPFLCPVIQPGEQCATWHPLFNDAARSVAQHFVEMLPFWCGGQYCQAGALVACFLQCLNNHAPCDALSAVLAQGSDVIQPGNISIWEERHRSSGLAV